MRKKEKKFDAVKMMRDIRDRLSVKYYNNTELLMKDLQEVRRKYKMKNFRITS